MTRDRRDTAGDGLLYIPDDDLVRSTVEGDDAEWSDARSYVPSDALISSVLQTSVRETPRFRFPDWYAAPQRGGVDPVRAASAVFAALQLSPATLAAATFLHVVALFALGPLTIGGGLGRDVLRHTARAVDAPRLVYLTPATPRPAPRRERRTVGVSVSRNGFRSVRPDSTAFTTSPATDSLPVTADRSARPDSAREDRELAMAVDREFLLGGDPLRVEADDRVRLEELARILIGRPLARLRVTGLGPALSENNLGARRGMREAETVARELIALGVARERIDLNAGVAERPCPERERSCVANRSRVRTSLAPSRP
jgi:hypothetical protein